MERLSCPFLRDIFVQGEELLNGTVRKGTLAYGLISLIERFSEDNSVVTLDDIVHLMQYDENQVNNPQAYLAHIENTGNLCFQLTDLLLQRDPSLDLPTPEEMRGRGFMHDLSKVYGDYKKTKQLIQEVDFYFHARHHGWETLANEVTMHACYLEILDMLYENHPFAKNGPYEKLQLFIQADGGKEYKKIKDFFSSFLEGKENLPLMILSVADYTAVTTRKEYYGLLSSTVDAYCLQLDGLFDERTTFMVDAHYYIRKRMSMDPTPLGISSVEKGSLERIRMYKDKIIYPLLRGDSLQDLSSHLWKSS